MLEGVQVLRFLAALSIVLLHSFHRAPWIHAGFDGTAVEFLEAGVDVFFVVSGFVMAYTIKPTMGTADFALRRLLRVVPLYWLISAVAAVLALTAPHYWIGTLSGTKLIESFTFTTPLPFYRVGWTLIYELLFYMVLAACLAAGKYRYVAAATAIAAITIGGAMFPTENYRYPWDAFPWRSPDGMMLEFLFGIVICRWHAALRTANFGAMLLVAIGFGLIVLSGTLAPALPRCISYGVPSALVVLGFVKSEAIFRGRWSAGLVLLGSASYSIYLSHFMVLNVIGKVLARNHLLSGTVPAVTIALLAVCGVVGGLICYLVIEIRLISAARHIHSRLLNGGSARQGRVIGVTGPGRE